ncbi:MAG: amino acid adenylation domain-containing protein, partial [Pirellula sp.]
MWFLDQFVPGSIAYNRPTILEFRGPLELSTLERSLNAILERHSVLRTVYRQVEGRPIQMVSESDPIKIQVVDLRSFARSELETETKRLAREETSRPFDLSHDPLFRAQCIRLADDKAWLIITTHHIAFDGWSQQILQDELAALYRAYQENQPSPLAELPLQYSDYAHWQRQWAVGPEAVRQLGWWQQTLKDAPKVLEIPSDHPRPSVQTLRGEQLPITLSRSLTEALRELAMKGQSTLFMVLMAAWNVLLHRYSGQEDILIGFPIAGRTRPETQSLIGLFINTLPLRTNLTGNPTFSELLSRVREASLAAYSNQDVPLQLLIENLSIPRDTSRAPLFQQMLALQNAPSPSTTLGALAFEPLRIDSLTSKLDLTLDLLEHPDGLDGFLEYNTDLFDRNTVVRMAGHFVTLLEGIVADPLQRIGQLPLLTQTERQQLLIEWNDTAVDHPNNRSVHELFEDQVQRTPDTVALVFRDVQISYRELNEQANQLANHLIGLGVGPGSLVGLCIERSEKLVVSILGILKAGAAYVPLDSEYPMQRLEFMLRDAAITLLVTQKALLERIPVSNCHAVCLDAEDLDFRFQATSNPINRGDAQNLAYVMFTSGSTGQPKGVQIPHRAVVNLLLAMAKQPGLTSEDRLLSVTNPTFDISVLEFLLPLVTGGSLEIASLEVLSDPDRLASHLSTCGATVMQATPATWQMLINHGWRGRNNLRILCGGESMPGIMAETLCPQSAQLWNMYGPTETTIYSTIYKVSDVYGCRLVGRPIDNTQVYVLDAQRQIVPIGVIGELYIGGAGLARGYLNRQELTAEKFVANPFTVEAGTKLYRTGDLARWNVDGNLEFLGRIDNQIKLRGFRIEVGEIETVLYEHPDVSQCAVILREDRPGDMRLVAYCVLAPGTRLNVSHLRNHLRDRLPDYMIPAAFVPMQSLPLTANGKLDRRALPAPDDSRPDLSSGYVAPRNPIEQQLASIWCDVLGIQQIGIHDNFFALGGHSLLAVRVLARITSVLQIQFPLRKLFAAPTIADLASEIGRLRSGGSIAHDSDITRLERNNIDRFPLSFAQQRLWFLEQIEGDLTAYNIPFAISLQGSLIVEALRRAIEEVVRRHEPLRTAFAMIGEEPLQIIKPIERFDLPVEDLRSLNAEQKETEIARRSRQEAEKPFDLTSERMLRATLLRLSDQEHVLLLSMHHIAVDGWSLRIFWRELGLLYDDYRLGIEPSLPELPVQYADYAVWQRRQLAGPRMNQLLQYWRQQLNHVSVLELPTDHPRQALPSYRGARHLFEIPELLTAQLQTLSQTSGATLHMTLLAAFQAMLFRYSGQDDIAIGVPHAGRDRSELEALIGFFVNTLVVRTDLSGNPTFRELLNRVRQVSLGAHDHQDLPFEKLVEELSPERQLNLSPLFQVLFQLLNFSEMELDLPNVQASRLLSDGQRVRFDLEMHVWQRSKILTANIVYSTDLFEAATIERMAGHFVRLLEGIVANPDQRISDLPLLTEPERHQLFIEWNNTALSMPRVTKASDLFDEQVLKTPNAIAIEHDGEYLTYVELKRRADSIAASILRCCGTRPKRVAVLMERSLDLVAAFLGILRSGAAYVPLDPAYPTKRIEFILENSQPELLLMQAKFATFPLPSSVAVLCVDDASEVSKSIDPTLMNASTIPSGSSNPTDVAYLLYTSGSTGQPKGVEMPHRAMINLIAWHQQEKHLREPARTLQFASCNFDVSIQEFLSTLCTGGTLIMVAEDVRRDPEKLWEFICREKIARLFVPFVMLQQLAIASRDFTSQLTDIISAGESLKFTPEVKRLLRKIPNCRLHNHYGPTETHVVTSYCVDREILETHRECPIGRPIANTQVYVLDAQLYPQPPGVQGDIWISGDCLALGYAGQPEMTNARFVELDLPMFGNVRMYKTGDRGHWRDDGVLIFDGRNDNQIKHRGFRIELGEIEAILHSHSHVEQAAVALRSNSVGTERLIAYYVRRSGSIVSSSQLMEHLREQLPDYMLPSAFVELQSLPLTASGKLDRRALPAPDDSRPDLETGYAPPRNLIEQQLASIWCEVLGIQKVGIYDNFFALGGHSLLAVRLNSRIALALRVKMPLRNVFESPTIAELAREITSLRNGSQVFHATDIKRIAHQQLDRLPLSFAQQRLWFLEQMEGELTAYNMPFAFRLHGNLDIEALRRAIEEVVRRHEPLRTTFAVVDDDPVQIIRPMTGFDLPVEDLRALDAQEHELEIVQRCRREAEKPFDLTCELMLRASILQLNDNEHVLLLTMHHIASDGWSLRVLWRELGALFDGFRHGSEPKLPDLPIRYSDFAIWQRSQLNGSRLEQLLKYWRERLEDVSPLELPTDYPRPALPSYRAAHHRFQIPEELVARLQSLSQSSSATLQMTLLAAFQTLLSRYSGQEDIAIGVPNAGRASEELEDLIGFFVNTLVLRTNMSGNPSFRELLSRIQQVSLEAYDHQDLPFERLVEELRPDRQLNRSPLVQVLFQLLSFSDTDLQLDSLDVSRLPSSSQRVRFDLEMHLSHQSKKLSGNIVYSIDLFDRSTIERMAGHFVTLLEGIVADPQQCIGQLPLLKHPERQQLLLEWNDTAVEYPNNRTVHELFELQVERNPEAIAVVFEDRKLTYRELNEQANQLAHHLIGLGVGPESRVGLCLERSDQLIVSILGILKAGGAYVPLDAAYPTQRLEFMLRDAGITFLVSQKELLERFPISDCSAVCLDDQAESWQNLPRSNPTTQVNAENLAYVMYTSGSTGTPKGVAIQHRAILRLVIGSNYANFTPDRRFLHVATPSFDASTFELWGALLHGAKLVVAPHGVPDFRQLEELIQSNRVTTLWLTSTLFNQLIDHHPQALLGVQEILTGGEALSVPHIAKAQKILGPQSQLVNGYGPTEGTTFTTCFWIPFGVAPEQASLPIGRPIANTQVYVLDAHRQLVPIGVPGELYIGGDGLARGYLNRTELTAEKFVPNPFSDHTDARLYRTGDLVRWRADGNL